MCCRGLTEVTGVGGRVDTSVTLLARQNIPPDSEYSHSSPRLPLEMSNQAIFISYANSQSTSKSCVCISMCHQTSRIPPQRTPRHEGRVIKESPVVVWGCCNLCLFFIELPGGLLSLPSHPQAHNFLSPLSPHTPSQIVGIGVLRRMGTAWE